MQCDLVACHSLHCTASADGVYFFQSIDDSARAFEV